MVLWSILLTLAAIPALASPVNYDSSNLGISFENGNTEAPLLKLPYGTWKGTYDEKFDTVTFRNIRFAAPPLGDLRWEKPAPPLKEEKIQDGSIGHSCLGTPFGGVSASLPPGAAAAAASGALPAMSSPSEDCLFLDLVVPAKVLESTEKHQLPVLTWIYGGAYGESLINCIDIN
jgi:carboxylesterase type B